MEERMRKFYFVIFPLAMFILAISCADEEREYFGAMEQVIGEGKEDSMSVSGPSASVEGSATQVWDVKNQWTDTATPAARKEGIAWPADSGLNWNQKYEKWIESLESVDSVNGYRTFMISTPWGKKVPAPVLECAEVAMFLRATFASWYNLPFYMQAVDGSGTAVYLGHFGWRTRSGKYGGSPDFKTHYKDFSNMTADDIARNGWPTDSNLRGRSLWGAQDDYQPFLGDNARAGTYFDEIYLNKRVGYFVLLLLPNFGSVNLADPSNMYNLKPEAISEGDVLLERWARRGIGHTLILKTVNDLEGGKKEAELASGSMPRRQPKWEDAAQSKYYFTMDATGGSGTNSDGDVYAKLGGGIKRWRVARQDAGVWVNTIMPGDVNFWISSTNYEAIGARPARFDELLGSMTPDEERDVLLRRIDDARSHLRDHPASCSARTTREESFQDLYNLMSQEFGMGKVDVDSQYRVLDDYVFAELDYTMSKTCCWDSTTNAMYRIIMDYTMQLVGSGGDGSCLYPVVFKNANSGYEPFQSYAGETGRAADWLPWSEDEPCTQRNVANDAEKVHLWTDFCEIQDAVMANTVYP
jgi:hypothetical protein